MIKGLGLTEQGFKIVNQDISLEWLMKNHGLPKDMKDFTPEQASKFQSLSWDEYPLEYKILDYRPEKWSPMKTFLFLIRSHS